MTGAEFAELVDWVQARWGRGDEVWANPDRFAGDFKDLDAAAVWTAFNRYMTAERSDLRWPPRPALLVRSALEVARHGGDGMQGELPEMAGSGERWPEWRQEHYPDLSWREAIRQRHGEIEGMRVTELGVLLPGESGFIEDGVDLRVTCRSPWCDVHRDSPLPTPDELDAEEARRVEDVDVGSVL